MKFCSECGADRAGLQPHQFCGQCGAPGVAKPDVAPVAPEAPPVLQDPALPQPASPPPTSTERLPGEQAHIPVSPSVGSIVFGLALLGLSAWLFFSWIPSKRPWEPGEQLLAALNPSRASEWRLKAPYYQLMYGIAVLLAIGGVQRIVLGATHRNQKEVFCQHCKKRVVGQLVRGGVRCPIKPHLAVDTGIHPLIVLAVMLIVVTAVYLAYAGRDSHAGSPGTAARPPDPAAPPALAPALPPAAAPTGPGEITSKTYRIKEDQYQMISFDLYRSAAVAVEFTVRSGPAIDQYVVQDADLEAYKKGQAFAYFEAISVERAKSGSRTTHLQAGRYTVILDNSNMGKASPPSNFSDDVVTVDVRILTP